MRAICVAEHSSWPAPRRKRAAGPSTGAPPMIGVTATQSSRRAATAARTPGTPRMVPIETTGLEGQITIASASAIACRSPGAGRAESMPSISMRVDLLGGPVAHQVLLEGPLPRRRRDAGAHRLVGHRQHGRLDAQARADLGRDRRETEALAHAQGAVDMGRQVAVAEPEPRLAPVGGEALQAAEGVRGVAPAALGDHPRQHVGADVEVRADAQPVEVAVVAGVDHRGEPGLAVDLRQSVHHLGAAGAPGQGEDHGRRAVMCVLTVATGSLPTAPAPGRARRAPARARATPPPGRPPAATLGTSPRKGQALSTPITGMRKNQADTSEAGARTSAR